MTSPHTLSEINSLFKTALKDIYSDHEIRNIGYLISEHLLNYSKINFHIKDGEPISSEMSEKFLGMLHRLKSREPVQYVTGITEFYGLPVEVDPRVLIPRPETEELVDWIIREHPVPPGNILDLGTGSGCIALALAVHFPRTAVSACDISDEILRLAHTNAMANQAVIRFFQFDLLDGRISLPEKYQVMVSNPPYVRDMEKASMEPNVLDYEPALALFVPDNDPLLYYRNIVLLGRKYLRDGGKLYLEINENFPAEVKTLLENSGFYGVEVRKDINGKARMVRGIK
jgi:release factor glutamine methyltransferase